MAFLPLNWQQYLDTKWSIIISQRYNFYTLGCFYFFLQIRYPSRAIIISWSDSRFSKLLYLDTAKLVLLLYQQQDFGEYGFPYFLQAQGLGYNRAFPTSELAVGIKYSHFPLLLNVLVVPSSNLCQVRDTLDKSYWQLIILLGTRILGSTIISWSACHNSHLS